MEGSAFVKKLPLIFKIGTSLDINTGRFSKFLVSCKILTGAILFIITTQNIGNQESVRFGGGKYAYTHDLLLIIILALSETAFIKERQQVLILIQFLLEPPFQRAKSIPLDVTHRFLRMVNIFGSAVFAVFTVSFFWSFTPLLSFFTSTSKSTSTFHIPFDWIPSFSESYLVTLVLSSTSVFYLASGVMHFFTWYPIIGYCAIKVKLMVKLLTLDVELLDDKAEQLVRDTVSNVVAIGRLPLCSKCRSPHVDPTYDHSSEEVDELVPGKVIKLWVFDTRECCKTEYSEMLEELYVNKMLDRIVDMHVELIRCVHLMDKSFQLSVLMYNQFAVVAALLIVPNVSSIQSMTGSEVIIVVFEVAGVLSTIGIINYCGQIVLNESERVVDALRNYKWYARPVSTRRRLLIMLTVATRPLRLTSGGIHTLSNETYSRILSAAYSYASVLQSLKTSGK